MVNAGLGKGHGIKPGEVVLVSCNQASAFMLPYIQGAILKAGGHMLTDFQYEYSLAESPREVLLAKGSEAQLRFLPLEARKKLFELADHRLGLKSQLEIKPSPQADTQAAAIRRDVEKEESRLLGEFRSTHWKSYTLIYVPTPAMATIAGVTLEEFWDVFIDTCFLREENAVGLIRQSQAKAAETADRLTALKPRKLKVIGDNVDLEIMLAPSAGFQSSTGGNVPSFETWTTPTVDGVTGWVQSTFPSLFENEQISNARFHFADGRCVKAVAEHGQAALDRMLSIPGMDRLGEFALTDKRHSLIRRALLGFLLPMENIGGTGHFAFGKPVAASLKLLSEAARQTTNHICAKHLDFVFGGDFTVIVVSEDGSEWLVYQDGQFTF